MASQLQTHRLVVQFPRPPAGSIFNHQREPTRASSRNTARPTPRRTLFVRAFRFGSCPPFGAFRRLHRISIFPHQSPQLIQAHSAPSKQAVGCLRFLESL